MAYKRIIVCCILAGLSVLTSNCGEISDIRGEEITGYDDYLTAKYFHGCTLSANIALEKPDWVRYQVLDGLTDDEIRSMLSIWKISGTTVYIMTYYGEYGSDEWLSPNGEKTSTVNSAFSPGCSCFSAATLNGGHILAYNNDEPEQKQNLIVFAKPPSGAASMSISLDGYTNITRYSKNLTDMDLRENVLKAPHKPYDGINQYGVCLSPTANLEEDREFYYSGNYQGRITLAGVMICRLILDKARNVYDALDILKKTTNSFGGWVQYLICDALGNSVVVEYWNGEEVITWKTGPFQILTNNRVNGHQNDMDYWMDVCHRYVKYYQMLSECKCLLNDEQEAMDFLGASCTPLQKFSSASNPLWSSVYNSKTLEWRLVWDKNWDKVYKFSIPLNEN
jgi:penicillin V acylase-like amidase (Ntn superfamily)